MLTTLICWFSTESNCCAALDVLAELHKLAGDPAAGEIAGGIFELPPQLGFLALHHPHVLVAAIELLAEGARGASERKAIFFSTSPLRAKSVLTRSMNGISAPPETAAAPIGADPSLNNTNRPSSRLAVRARIFPGIRF